MVGSPFLVSETLAAREALAEAICYILIFTLPFPCPTPTLTYTHSRVRRIPQRRQPLSQDNPTSSPSSEIFSAENRNHLPNSRTIFFQFGVLREGTNELYRVLGTRQGKSPLPPFRSALSTGFLCVAATRRKGAVNVPPRLNWNVLFGAQLSLISGFDIVSRLGQHLGRGLR